MRRKIVASEFVGLTLGHWTVLRVLDATPDGRRLCQCRCQCGTLRWIRLDYLTGTRGTNASCGCADPRPRDLKYGTKAHRIPEYRTWRAMKKRCRSSEPGKYARYGGRGIKVCDRWNNDFAAFLSDMGPRPSRKHSLDRIDVNGDYDPSNCRWATQKEQCRNKTTNVLLRCGDVIGTLAEWSEVCGVSDGTIRQRLLSGWSTLDAVLRPVDSRRGHRAVPAQRTECRL